MICKKKIPQTSEILHKEVKPEIKLPTDLISNEREWVKNEHNKNQLIESGLIIGVEIRQTFSYVKIWYVAIFHMNELLWVNRNYNINTLLLFMTD